MEKLFFQSSMPRAGSTLLQNILAQNPDIYATPTSGVLELIYAARANYTDSPEFQAQDSELMKEGFRNFCRQGVEGFYTAITGKKYVVDKSRGWGIHYDMLNFFYPEPKIICMVRDLRDIIASMEKNFRKSQHLSSPLVDHAQMQGTNTPKRVDIWVNSQPVGMALERLGEIYRQGIDRNMLFVKYEDLCMYPETEMTRIYKYLGIPEYQHDFDNVQQITQEDDSVYGVFGDHTIRTEVKPLASQAKSILGQDVCNWIWDTYKWYFNQFGYRK